MCVCVCVLYFCWSGVMSGVMSAVMSAVMSGVMSTVMSHLILLKHRCILKHVAEEKTEGRIKVTGRRERICKQLLEDINKKKEWWKLNVETLDHILWRTRFRRGHGPVVRQSDRQSDLHTQTNRLPT